MIQVLFFIFIALVIFHFIFEGIIAPNLRFKVRTNLFALRDRVRMLKLDNPDTLSDEVFFYVQDEINKQLRKMHHYTFVNLFRATRIADPVEIQGRVKRQMELLNASEHSVEINEIYDKVLLQFVYALIANSGAWSLYLLPIIIPFLLGLYGLSRVRSLFTEVSLLDDDTAAAH